MTPDQEWRFDILRLLQERLPDIGVTGVPFIHSDGRIFIPVHRLDGQLIEAYDRPEPLKTE